MPASLSARVAPRVALSSILGFWLFYFAVATSRSLAISYDDQVQMAGFRALVCLAGIGITILLYLVLRRTRSLPLGAAILVAAVASIPAAVGYSTANWYVFYQLRSGPRAKIFVQRGTPDKSLTIAIGGDPHPAGEEVSAFELISDNSMNGYFFMVAWSAFYFALAYAAATREAERSSTAFRAAAQAAELRALRYQVSPHFLFNTLNSLSSLVLKGDRDEAERMIQNLATFFRTSLTGDAAADVTLAEEIDLQRLYLAIETVRFRDRLAVAIDVPAALADACVPGLILQPLVENAIKYGVSRTGRPIQIRIAAAEDARGLVLQVTDDGDPLPTGEGGSGTGVGLANVRDRLAARYGALASCHHGPLTDRGYSVVLTLPLVRNGC